MPPRGRKAFVSRSAAAARAAAAESDGEQAEEVAATTTKPLDGAATNADADDKKAAAPPAPSAAPSAAPADGSAKRDDEDEDSPSGDGKETRGQMIQRHKRETKAQKEVSKRLGKKKKEETAAAEAALVARHEAELRAFDEASSAAPGGSASDAASDSLSRFKLDDREDDGEARQLQNLRKGSKAARRRAERLERESAKEAERDAERAAAAGTGAGSLEAEELRSRVLGPLGLEVFDVPADGHCLYAALSHQLRLAKERGSGAEGGTGGGEQGATPPSPFDATVASLRSLAATHIRANAASFEPFLDDDELEDGEGEGRDDGEGGEGGGGEAATKVERYCRSLEATAAWGGQPELQALAEALPARITVLSVGMDPVVVEAGGPGGEESKGRVPELTICYLRHAFGLGEHYNSTVVAPAAAADAASSGEEGKGAGDRGGVE